jgi:MFS family permease
VVNVISDAISGDSARDWRWLILAVIAVAQLMVVLDLTVMNIALPSAQRALHFTIVERQWVVSAYTLAFGSLLLLGGRLADLLGRKVTFLAGLAGFAGVSAIGGASVNFAMLITARACQGAFAALLVPSALSLLTTTFTEQKDRGKAFGIYGAIAGVGGAIGLLLGGVDRVPVLAVGAVREPDLRRSRVHRWAAPAEAAAVPGQAQARRPGRAAGL